MSIATLSQTVYSWVFSSLLDPLVIRARIFLLSRFNSETWKVSFRRYRKKRDEMYVYIHLRKCNKCEEKGYKVSRTQLVHISNYSLTII